MWKKQKSTNVVVGRWREERRGKEEGRGFTRKSSGLSLKAESRHLQGRRAQGVLSRWAWRLITRECGWRCGQGLSCDGAGVSCGAVSFTWRPRDHVGRFGRGTPRLGFVFYTVGGPGGGWVVGAETRSASPGQKSGGSAWTLSWQAHPAPPPVSTGAVQGSWTIEPTDVKQHLRSWTSRWRAENLGSENGAGKARLVGGQVPKVGLCFPLSARGDQFAFKSSTF